MFLLLFAAMAARDAAAAPPLQKVSGETRLSAWVPDEVTVLDVSIAKGWAALKIVGHMGAEDDFESGPSVDCQYPGMTKWPRSGVRIATWNLATRQVGDIFEVYAIAQDPADCSPTATNEANLAAAKAKILALGLDIARKPKPITTGISTEAALPIGTAGVVVHAYDRETGQDENAMTHDRQATLAVGGTVFYQLDYTYSGVGAGSEQVSFAAAYVEGNKAVFLEHWEFTSMMGTYDAYSFSPVFDLSK